MVFVPKPSLFSEPSSDARARRGEARARSPNPTGKTYGALLLGLGAFLVVSGAVAQTAAGATEAPSADLLLRVAGSKKADERLSVTRLRRLLRIELGRLLEVDRWPAGPLGRDQVVRVWFDVPSAEEALIEVRRTGRPLARRRLGIGRYPADVASRIVALEASEMIRVQAQAPRRSSDPAATAEARALARAERVDLSVRGGASATLVFDDLEAFVGPELALSVRDGWFGVALFGRHQIGLGSLPLRWSELGGGIDVRWVPSAAWRLRMGGMASLVGIGAADALAIAGRERDTGWVGRAGGSLGAETAVGDAVWLSMDVSPSALLAPVYLEREATRRRLRGFALGFSLGIAFHPRPFEDGS